MADMLIRNIDTTLVEKLKRRASQNKRSLQAELTIILEQACTYSIDEFREVTEQFRKKTAGRKHTDSTILIAEDRSR